MIETLTIATATVLGLFAGGMLTEAYLLVPYFRSLKPQNFYALHHEFGPRLYRYYAPLTISATVIPLSCAAIVTFVDPANALLSCVVAAISLLMLAIYFLYFRQANASFANERLSEDELKHALTRWSSVHSFRTVLALVAFIVSIVAAM